MKKKAILLIATSVLAVGVATGVSLFAGDKQTEKMKAGTEEYSLTITDPIYEGTSTSGVGSKVYKTALGNDIKIEYDKLDEYEEGYQHFYATGVNCLKTNGAYIAIVANNEGHGVAGIESIDVLLDNDTYGSSTLLAWYGWEDGTYIRSENYKTSDGGHEYSFRLNDTGPTFIKLELTGGNDGNRVGIHQLKINYSCSETENPFIIEGDYVLVEAADHLEVDSYRGTSTDLVFPSSAKGKPVTKICDNFSCSVIDKDDITSVTLPSSIKYIGDSAFYYAQKLTSIDLRNVEYIGDFAFNYANNLTTITGFDSIKSIGTNAFYVTSSLEDDLVFPASLTTINGTAFMYSHIKSVYIDDDAEAYIYDAAFRSTKITSIYIGNSVAGFYDDLTYCSELETITVGALNENYKAVDNVLYGKNSSGWTLNRLAQARAETTYIMPNDVTQINPYSAYQSTTLETLVVNDVVTSIPNYSFDGCENLSSITIGSAVEIIDYCFNYCAITSITIPSNVRYVYQRAFQGCDKLETVIIEEGLSHLSGEAFRNCTALTTVVLPTTLIDTGGNESWSGEDVDVFSGCTALTNVFTRLTSGTYSGEDIRSGWYGARTMNLYSESEAVGCWHFNGSGVPVLW